jgi:hypothetical protein
VPDFIHKALLVKLAFNPRSVDEMDLPTSVKEFNTFAARSNRCILFKKIRQKKKTLT